MAGISISGSISGTCQLIIREGEMNDTQKWALVAVIFVAAIIIFLKRMGVF